MPVVDILSAALSGPAGRVVDGPVRNIVNEVLRDHGYASPAEVQGLRDELSELRDQVHRYAGSVEALRAEVEALRAAAAAAASAPAASAPAASAPAASAPAASAAVAAPAPAQEAAAPAQEAAAVEPAVAAAAERLGLTLDQYEQWRAGGLEGYIGPDGYVEINGEAWRVDAALEGRPYTLTRHASPRVQVDGTVVSKTRVA